MRLKIGNWAGGASDNSAGTIEWAGGAVDWDDAPFTMVVKSVEITNNNPVSIPSVALDGHQSPASFCYYQHLANPVFCRHVRTNTATRLGITSPSM